MKKYISLISLLFIAGCHSWPKDAYIEDAESTINTPWGPSTQKAKVIATGSAARNASLPEMPVKPAKK